VRIDAADLERLQRRRQAALGPRGRLFPDGCLLFVPGTLRNPLNDRKLDDHHARAAWRRLWRDKVADALLEVGYRRGQWDPAAPKRVTIVGHVRRRFDLATDGLRAACKPIPDALKLVGVIDDDRDSAGHEFTYDQVVDRLWLGVEVHVRLGLAAEQARCGPER